MTEIIGIKFKQSGKVYYFSPAGTSFKAGDKAVVETARGIEMGDVCIGNQNVPDEEIVKPLKPIIRKASPADIAKAAEFKAKEEEALEICRSKIEQHKLEMKLISAEYAFDGSKLLFYFISDGRVDFRELVRSLASVFHTRIELRQIGVRDEAKLQGGLGMCGRPFCCSSFLPDFIPVSIKMAKEQGLSLNPVKISGTCGRLMCCLKYEQEAYDDLLKITPKVGAIVDTPQGRGTVTDVNILKGKIKVRLDASPDAVPPTFMLPDIKIIRDKKIVVDKQELLELKNIE